ncbi:hypothetical protein CesoFtcFv8_017866 [Champsocephalus esox]|uniref:Immunoglobulin C1-set domain-containing protein n=1 Tax=Champsocephalus esox TaxID=159716 RepID=A0AAN8BLJ8_9TELE|nr:hypothetical protein CesoFtcFv8_017866 [Champsocephalus esox]
MSLPRQSRCSLRRQRSAGTRETVRGGRPWCVWPAGSTRTTSVCPGRWAGGAVSSGVATDSSAALREDKTYRISSRLRVSASDWFTPDRKFTCRVSFFNGTHTSHHEHTVEGVQGAQAAMTREKYLKTTQAAKLSYVVFIVKSSVYGAGVAFLLWRLQGSAGKQNN